MPASFIPLYYCGDNLTVALNTPYQSLPNIIETIYFNVSELGADQPIYGHTDRLPSQFSPGTRLIQGTLAVPMGLLPDWVMNYPNQGNGTLTVQPENNTLPLLIIKAVNIQGIHQSISPDGQVSLQTVSFIGIRDADRVEVHNQQLDPKDIIHKHVFLWELWAGEPTWNTWINAKFPVASPFIAPGIEAWSALPGKEQLKLNTITLMGDDTFELEDQLRYMDGMQILNRWAHNSLYLWQHADLDTNTSDWYFIEAFAGPNTATPWYTFANHKLSETQANLLTAWVTG